MKKLLVTLFLPFLLFTVASAIIGGNLGNQTVPASSERYACVLGTSTLSENESEREIILSQAITLTSLTVRVNGTQPNDGFVFVYVRKNGQDTNLLVYVDPGDGNLTASVGSEAGVSFAAGDRISLKIENYSESESLKFNAFSLK